MVPDPHDGSSEYCVDPEQINLTDRRVSILACLRDRDRPLSLSDLATWILKHEQDRIGIEPASGREAIERVRIQLHHIDLPLLDDANLLAYDPTRWTVTPSAVPNDHPELVDLTRRTDDY